MLNKQYMSTIFQALKATAFHQLYMEKLRIDLANNQLFDPLTAYKSIDLFKHDKVIPYEIFSFLDSHGYKSASQLCQSIITAVNKRNTSLTFTYFVELALPFDSALREASLTRYDQCQNSIDLFLKLDSIKKTSSQKIALLLSKQVEFYKELQFIKQSFCQRYGGDLYTFNQIIFKGKKKTACFQEFYSIARQYDFFFNEEEFRSIWMRMRSTSNQKPEFLMDNLHYLLLTNNLDLKSMRENRLNIAQNSTKIKPSYREGIREREAKLKRERQQKQTLSILDRLNTSPGKGLRHDFIYPQQHYQNQEMRWKSQVNTMRLDEINIRYGMKRRF